MLEDIRKIVQNATIWNHLLTCIRSGAGERGRIGRETSDFFIGHALPDPTDIRTAMKGRLKIPAHSGGAHIAVVLRKNTVECGDCRSYYN